MKLKFFSCAVVAFAVYLCVFLDTWHAIKTAFNLGPSPEQLTTKCPYLIRPAISSHNSLSWKPWNTPLNLVPVAVDSTHRHGTRFPSPTLWESWKILLHRIIMKSSSSAFTEAARTLKRDFPLSLNYSLHTKGVDELHFLAEELFQITRNMLSDPNLSVDDFQLLTSPKLRCVQSGNVFIDRLLQKINKKRQDDNKLRRSDFMLKVDGKLRRFDDCFRYKKAERGFDGEEGEYVKFLASKIVRTVAEEVNSDYGLDLDNGEVMDLFKLCMFKFALYDDATICNVFNTHQQKILEYGGDLKHYYKTGHGRRISHEMYCSFLAEVITQFDAVIRVKNHKPKVVLRFAHAETVIPIVAFLGLFKDEQNLTVDTYHQMKESRLWRTSVISPFASNINFILYADTKLNDTFYASVTVNGDVLQIPGSDCRFCPYRVFRRLVMDKLNNLEGGRSCDNVCR